MVHRPFRPHRSTNPLHPKREFCHSATNVLLPSCIAQRYDRIEYLEYIKFVLCCPLLICPLGVREAFRPCSLYYLASRALLYAFDIPHTAHVVPGRV